MLKKLQSNVVGAFASLLFCFNTIFWCSILFLFIPFKLFIPIKATRRYISRVLIFIAFIWIKGNSLIFGATQKVKWDVQGVDELTSNGSHLVVSNHRSWTDIFVLQHIFQNRIPFLKFFLKKELIWVPVLGIAWWALDFPFLKRYSPKFLKKHPELRGKDMETTRKSCEKFKEFPVSVMNFLEGTRFDYEKHKKQKSPYRYLLPPKAGGAALVFSNMGDYLSSIIDVTIIYPENEPPVNFWDLLSGKIPCITVRVRALPVPENIGGKNYEEDGNFKRSIRQWINNLWEEKDQQIEEIMTEYNASIN